MIIETIQAAAQAVETGKSSISVFFDAGVIGLILTNSALLIKAFIDRRAVKKEKDNTAPLPCENHRSRLVILESSVIPERLATLEANYATSSKAIDDMRKENREDHKQIFEAINHIRVVK